jgi:hypothetical protein
MNPKLLVITMPYNKVQISKPGAKSFYSTILNSLKELFG